MKSTPRLFILLKTNTLHLPMAPHKIKFSIELKVCDKPRETFTKCDEALDQIKRNKYELELIEEGYEDIIKYGISFYRKDCLIKVK